MRFDKARFDSSEFGSPLHARRAARAAQAEFIDWGIPCAVLRKVEVSAAGVPRPVFYLSVLEA